MRRNRKVSRRQSVVGMNAARLGVVLAAGLIVVIVNLLASSSCNQLMKSIGEKDRILQSKMAELERADARWEAMCSTDNLTRALGRRGLVMTYAKTDRIIRMDGGVPQSGQRSVALARQRMQDKASATASASTPSRRRSHGR